MHEATKESRRAWPLGAALALAVGAGIVATAFAGIVLVVTRAAFAFADRVDLVRPVDLSRWEGRITWALAFCVVAIAIRAGVVLAAPDTPTPRVWASVLVGLGAGLVLVASPYWPAAAVGAGWGFGLGRTPVEMGVAGGVGVVVALLGFATDVVDTLDAAVAGTIGAVIVAVALGVAHLVADRLPGPTGGA